MCIDYFNGMCIDCIRERSSLYSVIFGDNYADDIGVVRSAFNGTSRELYH